MILYEVAGAPQFGILRRPKTKPVSQIISTILLSQRITVDVTRQLSQPFQLRGQSGNPSCDLHQIARVKSVYAN